MNIFADLHNHTTASDGDFSPEELIHQAKRLGIKVIGITDHDTLKGLESGLAAGDSLGIEIVPGVEISICFHCSYFKGSLHLLCYFTRCKLQDSYFVNEFENLLQKSRKGLAIARIREINKFFGPKGKTPLLGREMKLFDITGLSDNPSRRHFSICLKEKFGIRDENIINLIIGNKSPAYLPSGIELDIVKKFLKKSTVLPVLAHPAAGSFPGTSHYKEVLPPIEIVEKLFPDFLAAGIKGIEINYPGHTLQHRNLLRGWAEAHDLLITGGSDSHDSFVRPIGIEGISESEFNRFKAALMKS